jgi:hypothetical protein
LHSYYERAGYKVITRCNGNVVIGLARIDEIGYTPIGLGNELRGVAVIIILYVLDFPG